MMEIIQLLFNFGFPAIACYVMFKFLESFMQKQLTRYEAQQDETVKALQQIIVTMTVFNERLSQIENTIQKGGD